MGAGAAKAGGMALQIVGSQVEGWASLLDKWAMADAFSAEMARQAAFQREASGVFNTQLKDQSADAAKGQLADAYGGRLAKYNAIDAVPLTADSKKTSLGSRDAVRDSMMSSERANLEKYGDWSFGRKLGNMKMGRELDRITNFAGGTARVFPYRMYDAQHAYDSMAEAGQAIYAAGSGLQGSIPSAPGGGTGQNMSPGNYYDPATGGSYPSQYGSQESAFSNVLNKNMDDAYGAGLNTPSYFNYNDPSQSSYFLSPVY